MGKHYESEPAVSLQHELWLTWSRCTVRPEWLVQSMLGLRAPGRTAPRTDPDFSSSSTDNTTSDWGAAATGSPETDQRTAVTPALKQVIEGKVKGKKKKWRHIYFFTYLPFCEQKDFSFCKLSHRMVVQIWRRFRFWNDSRKRRWSLLVRVR